jgi:hypothetical protein
LPIVLPDGTLLAGRGLNRRYGIVFRIPVELDAFLPTTADCTSGDVAKAMHCLADEWLVDVTADYQGKCTLIACALTIIERVLLSQRPAFFVTAGQRGGGKTTCIHMLSMAAGGLPAAAWSSSEEERRKALFAYLGAGLTLLVWDNISRGSLISCPSIEKALTTEFYSDRILGESTVKTVPAHTVQVITGNNVTPRGDLASRALLARLRVDRPDPENREFTHPDTVAWTNANRGRILHAFYTILLGNPRRRQKRSDLAPAQTRFKEWWNMVGSAVEYAAAQHTEAVNGFIVDGNSTCPARSIAFKKMFLAGEADDEQANSLALVLDVLRQKWPPGFSARDVAIYASKDEDEAIDFRTALEVASDKPFKNISSTTVTWRLKALADPPVQVGDAVLGLKYKPDHQGGAFAVETIS